MKALFWGGMVVLVLGMVSLWAPIPSNDQSGVSVGNLSIDIETRHDEKVSPVVSAAMILGGAGLMVAARKKG